MKSAARDIGRILWYLSALCILMLLLFPAKAFSLLYGDIPVIGDISPDQIITDSTSATLYASGVTDNDRIARVWAIIQLPNDTPGVETDFQESYTLEFKKTAGEENRYEGTFDGFDAIGTYYIRIYARDWLGKTSKPGLTTVAAHKPLRSLVIILAGTSGDENEQIAIEKSAKLAWDTLIHKGFSENDLYLLSSSDIPGVNISPVSATPGNLNYAINTWAKENGRELLLYMVGDGSTREFKMDDSHVLSAVDLNSWLDNLQAYLTGQVAVITDAPYSWAYLSALQPQTNTDRILISGTGLNQAANFFSQNAFVFSMFFWNSVFSGANMSDAFVQAQHVLTWTEFRQKPHIDANGNGVPDELADHELSEDFNIGSTVDFPGTSPAIGSVGGIEKSADMHINIWASDVSSSGNIDQVLAIVVPPPFGNQKQEKIPLSTIDMPWNAANNRYEAEYNLLDSTGIYRFAIYAIDEYNRVSQPMETSVTHVSTLKDIYENDDTWEAANFILLSSAEFKDSGFDIQDHSQLHNFHTETDEDWVKFHAQKDGIYHIRVKDVGDKNDPILRIYKSDGQTLIDELEGKTNKFIDDAFTGDNEDFDWTCPADGIYYAMIRQWQPEDYPNEADLCHPSSGEGTEYRLVFFIPAMSFDSYIWGEIMPHDANAQITSDAGSLALQEPTGYFGMPHIAGTFTLTATASGYKQYDKIIAVPEILSTQIDAIILTEDTSIPTADFSGSPVSGNAPLTTQFTDESKKVVTSWLWDFGDDTPNSEEQNPAHKYQNSGTYTVKLTATGHGEDTKVRIEYIQVNPPPPIAHFTADQTTGIAPLNVKFSDQSTGGPTSWSWDFGDTGTSDVRHPTHEYSSPGTYSVKLTADASTEEKTDFIVVTYPPSVAAFTADTTTGNAPLTVNFTDGSSGDVNSWSWDFGDAGTSDDPNPTHEYSSRDTPYTVKLTVNGPGGEDTNEKIRYIKVSPEAIVANFKADPLTGISPLTVKFTDQSTGGPTSWTWDFGDTGTSYVQHPTHEYSSPDTYTVKLTADASTEEKTGFIVVTYPPSAAVFTADKTTGEAPLTVNFTDESSGDVNSWSWNFGDTGTSDDPNPTHEYSSPGTYTVILTVNGPGGENSEQKTEYIKVIPPPSVANFTAEPLEGSAPHWVSFTDRSKGNATSWAWDFGDGNTGEDQNPKHQYNDVGVYTVKLTVDGPGNEDSAEKIDYITVSHPRSVADFTASTVSGIAPLTVTFTDSSKGDATSWAWDFGDDGASQDQNPTHQFVEFKTYTVKLTVDGPGGEDAVVKTDYIEARHPVPVANFGVTPDILTAPASAQFTDKSVGTIESWTWDFGDDDSSNEQHPAHIYVEPGEYPVQLSVTGPGGTDKAAMDLIIRKQFSTQLFRTEAIWPSLQGAWYFNSSTDLVYNSSNGFIYIADSNNHYIKAFSIQGEFETKWGGLGTRSGQLDSPQSIAVDSNGGVYVADSGNNRIQKFTRTGGFVTSWGKSGKEDGQFHWPSGIAVDGSGYVYVTDERNDRIQKFSPEGGFELKWGISGSSNKEFNKPCDIAIDGSGAVYVVDPGNHRIQKFNGSGEFLLKWGIQGNSNGEFAGPTGIAIDPGNNIYVSDAGNSTVQVFNQSGEFLSKWGTPGTDEGELNGPSGLMLDGGGNIYVADTWNDRIQKFSAADGSYIGEWGSSGSDNGTFWSPFGLTTDGEGNVYVADYGNDRISKLTPDGLFETGWGSTGSGEDDFSGPSGIAFSPSGLIFVVDSGNNRIKKYNKDGQLQLQWGSEGSGQGQFRFPRGVAVDSSGNVYVVDTENDRIQKFNADGDFVRTWGVHGTTSGDFDRPSGIAICKDDFIYVVDYGNHRVQKFDADGNFILEWGGEGHEPGKLFFPLSISFDSDGDAFVVDRQNSRIQKFKSSGQLITQFAEFGSGFGQLNVPTGISVNDKGRVVVADTGNNRIQVYKEVDLADVILALQILSGMQPSAIYKDFDINDDGTIGLAEVIYVLKKAVE